MKSADSCFSHSQGIDDDGHVANFVESEQIVKTRSATFSFLQVRGSSASAAFCSPLPVADPSPAMLLSPALLESIALLCLVAAVA